MKFCIKLETYAIETMRRHRQDYGIEAIGHMQCFENHGRFKSE